MSERVKKAGPIYGSQAAAKLFALTKKTKKRGDGFLGAGTALAI